MGAGVAGARSVGVGVLIGVNTTAFGGVEAPSAASVRRIACGLVAEAVARLGAGCLGVGRGGGASGSATTGTDVHVPVVT